MDPSPGPGLLGRFRRNWLAQAEVSEAVPSGEPRGLSFFFVDAVELAAFRAVVALPPAVEREERALRQRYDFLPRTWIKLAWNDAATPQACSQYLVIDPRNRYPITTLRQLVRRFPGDGDGVGRLEAGLEPALDDPETMWAAIVKHAPGDGGTLPRPVLRLSCRVARTSLAHLLDCMTTAGLIDEAVGAPHLATNRELPAADSVYVTFEPGDRQVLALDYEAPEATFLAALGAPPTTRYLKCRHRGEHRQWTAYRPLPDALAPSALDALCDVRHTAEGVRGYFDEHTHDIVAAVGTTYQAALLGQGARATNLHLASLAGIAPGMRVLDLGCGACGPAVDLAACHPELSVDAVTISPVQAAAATAHVRASGLADRIRVRVADYDALALPPSTYDRVLFLESLGYTGDLAGLLARVAGTLVAGGRVFIKDVLLDDGPLSAAQRLELAEFRGVYRFHGFTVKAVVDGLLGAGLVDVRVAPLDERYGLEAFHRAMQGTPFGMRVRRQLP